ncbi:MAG: ATP-binding protein [bacterium]|nr:ATP-binding protein [bacterium]
MALPPLIRPKVEAQPTLDTAIWFLQLRWVAVCGQLLTMAVVTLAFRIALPNAELLALIGITAVTNFGYWLWLSHLHRTGVELKDRLPAEQVIPCLMLCDIVVLTGMLYLTAGIANPFALFYFVNIAVAGAIISTNWAWAIWLATVAGVTLLLISALPLAPLSSSSLQSPMAGDGKVWTIPKLGFAVSFAACSGVITYFITVLTGELRQREKALQEAEDARIRNRQLEGLATLAAGAAHELASPLSTIAVVAKELDRALEKQPSSDAARRDVSLIRSELDQCRVILDRMTSAAGEAAGERLRSISLSEFLQETLLGIRQRERVIISIPEDSDSSRSLLPVQAAAQAVRNLVQNALDASPTDAQVDVEATASSERWRITVRDSGCGMPPEVMERIGEPFFTTKEPGRGMGLGVYLTQNVARRLDGNLRYESQPAMGTTACLEIPTQR